jgi:hypothetical protein
LRHASTPRKPTCRTEQSSRSRPSLYAYHRSTRLGRRPARRSVSTTQQPARPIPPAIRSE